MAKVNLKIDNLGSKDVNRIGGPDLQALPVATSDDGLIAVLYKGHIADGAAARARSLLSFDLNATPFRPAPDVWYLPALDERWTEITWTAAGGTRSITKTFNSITKHPSSPILDIDGGFLSVALCEDEKYRFWYQGGLQAGSVFEDCLSYAESDDGITVTAPDLGTFSGLDTRSGIANTVFAGVNNKVSGPLIMKAPDDIDGAGYKWLCFYRSTGGLRIIGSNDLEGKVWDLASDQVIIPHSMDTQSSFVRNPSLEGGWILYSRFPEYGIFGGESLINDGQDRRISAVKVDRLWEPTPQQFKRVLQSDDLDFTRVPDALDPNRTYRHMYVMPTARHESGLIIGYPCMYALSTFIQPDLAWSLDGFNFSRPSVRTPFIELGADTEPDDGNIIPAPGWIDPGDGTYRIYYAMWDGAHSLNVREIGDPIPVIDGSKRNGRIGLGTIRKDGWCMYTFPTGAGEWGIVSSRPMVVPPNCRLHLNADGTAGNIKVRLLDPSRRNPPGTGGFGVIPGFDWSDLITTDSVDHTVVWPGSDVRTLAGQTIRVEVYGENTPTWCAVSWRTV